MTYARHNPDAAPYSDVDMPGNEALDIADADVETLKQVMLEDAQALVEKWQKVAKTSPLVSTFWAHHFAMEDARRNGKPYKDNETVKEYMVDVIYENLIDLFDVKVPE